MVYKLDIDNRLINVRRERVEGWVIRVKGFSKEKRKKKKKSHGHRQEYGDCQNKGDKVG